MDAMMTRTRKHFHWLIYGALTLAIAIAGVGNAFAQSVTFGASVTNANGSLETTLTWDAPGASTCVASGHPAWEGQKPSAGVLELPVIDLSGTYQLTLVCHFPSDRTARLTWNPPTHNTDGSLLTNLAGYTIHYGRSASALTQSVAINNPAQVTYVLENLDPGEWFFAIRARNTQGVESALSNVVVKTIEASTTSEASVSLTVNPVPQAPVLELVE